MNKPIIEASNLGFKAGCQYILKNIDWEIYEGDHWVVFGLNGSGKTTLLSTIAGYNAYTDGVLKIFGQQYNDNNILDLRKKIGWVSSSFFDKCLSKETALEIILSGLFATLGLDYGITDQDMVRAKNLMRELRLLHKIDYPFDLLSKGERQIVLLTRALISNPQVLILDEPGSGLDVFNREYLLSTVKDLAKSTNITIIYVTHYTEEILEIFNNCLLLKNGRIYAQGSIKDIFNSQYLSEFLDYPVAVDWQNERINVTLTVDSNIKYLLE